MGRPEATERDRFLAAVGSLPGVLAHRCEPMTNAYRVRSLPDGFPDVLFAAKGVIVLVEWKARTGRLGEAQIRYHASMAAAGYQVLLARDAGQCCRDLERLTGYPLAKVALELDNKKVAADCK